MLKVRKNMQDINESIKLETRAGGYVVQPTGYRAFMPAPLPPKPSVNITGELQKVLSKADRGVLVGSMVLYRRYPTQTYLSICMFEKRLYCRVRLKERRVRFRIFLQWRLNFQGSTDHEM